MAWTMLIIAGLLEIGFALSLKATNGFTRPLPTLLFALFGAGSFYLLTQALRTLPVGTAYAVWVGIGAGTTVGWAILTGAEPASPLRIALVLGLVGCVVGLKLTH